MYLKQIEVENFKSFGKRMTIPMLNGFTAVTGPNGSGKSNISDAILFVLGPKSSKAIRAGRLTDLIFNGGPSKQPSSYTKVSLVFDNKDRLIPIDDDIVRLTRHVKLSESETGYNSYFYVNDRKSSLNEFDYLLASARISADGYNLVQQGDVTRIVEMSPLERRRLMDDISGISKFDEDIVKAEGERKGAEENMDRIGIIMNELEKQLHQLEVEKAAALRFMEARDRLALSRSRMAHKKKEAAESEVNATRAQIDAYNKDMEALRLRKAEIGRAIADAERRIIELEAQITEKGGQEFKDLKERMDAAKIEIARATDAAQRSDEEGKELQETLRHHREERNKLQHEVRSIDDKHKVTEETLLDKQRLLEERRKQQAEVQSKISASDSELSALERRLLDLDAQVSEGEEKVHSLTMDKDRQEDRLNRLKAELAENEESKGNLEFQIKDAEWRLREIQKTEKSSTGELSALQTQFFAKRSQEAKMAAQLDELEQAIKTLTREYNHISAEKEAVENLAKGYNRAVRSLLEARDKHEIRGIHGTVAELAKVDPKYDIALNVAAGARMQSVIVDDDEVASEAIQFLKRNNLGRATFLPLNKMLDGKPRGKAQLVVKEAVGYAIDLIDFEERYRPAFWYVFGDTVVVQDLAKARKLMGGVRLVTAGGELIEASGAMVGGTLDTNTPKFGQSSKGKLEEIAEELRKSVEHSEKLTAQLKALRLELQQVESRMRELSGSESNNEIKISGLEATLKDLKGRMAKGREEATTKAKESEELRLAIERLSKEVASAASKVEQTKSQRELARQRQMEIAPKDLTAKLRALQSEVVELTASVAELNSEKATGKTQMDLLRKRLEEMDQFEAGSKEKSVKLRSEGEEARAKEAKLRVELNGMRRIEDSMGKEMNDLRAKKEACVQGTDPVGVRPGQAPDQGGDLAGLRHHAQHQARHRHGAHQGVRRRDRADQGAGHLPSAPHGRDQGGDQPLRVHPGQHGRRQPAFHRGLRGQVRPACGAAQRDQTPGRPEERPHQAHQRTEREEEGRSAQGVRRGQRELPHRLRRAFAGRRRRAAAGEPRAAVRGRLGHEVPAQARQGAAVGGAKRRGEVAGSAELHLRHAGMAAIALLSAGRGGHVPGRGQRRHGGPARQEELPHRPVRHDIVEEGHPEQGGPHHRGDEARGRDKQCHNEARPGRYQGPPGRP